MSQKILNYLDPQMSYEQNEKNGSKLLSNIETNGIQRTPYPKRVFFVIATKFCERMTFNGISAILALYLKYKLGYTEKDATVLYHSFNMMLFCMCLIGGIISDVWLGKFKTIFYFSIIFWFGSTIVAISSIPILYIPPKITLIVGLLIIAIGCGCMKPSLTAFGGDQFKLPEQATQAATFFSFFYFGTCLGATLSTLLTPILREDIQCFGERDCFSLAFLIPVISMFAGIVLLVSGRSWYTHTKPSSENIFVQVVKCITHAISTRIREGRKNSRKNLLDYSLEKYGEQLVGDTRVLLRILVLYLPLPLFWTLFNQQASRWTFQADRMNGDLGFYTIKPDQMLVLESSLVLMFIPLFEALIYPILYKIGIQRPLQKMVMGLSLTAVAFLLSGLVQFRIESSPGESVSMLWLLPQYAALSVGEILFSPTGLSFSYEEAPERMKSVVQALWQLTVAVGDLILLFITKLAIFDSQAYEFLLFSGLMFVGMLIFAALAFNFESSTRTEDDSKYSEQCVPLRLSEENASFQ